MPNKDKTGPLGKGPNTGRGMGPCEENKNNQNRGFGRRFRRFGRGFGRNFNLNQEESNN